jgi:predicted HAD superfamily phosphohydrolase
MTTAVQQLLNSFDALPDADKHAATIEILRRISAKGDVAESTFVEVADELFSRLDSEEDGHAQH